MLKALDVLGVAKWPSLALILVVPVLSYVGGWNSGAGVRRVVVAEVGLDGQRFRLWQGPPAAGEVQWCAQPLAQVPSQMVFVHGGGRSTTEFDAGQFCASLPVSAGRPRLATG
jgi:hypothetical protein